MKNLRSRLDRLEQSVNKGGKKCFDLGVLYGSVPMEQLDDETRTLVESLFAPRQPPRDIVEEFIAKATGTPSTPMTDDAFGSCTA